MPMRQLRWTVSLRSWYSDCPGRGIASRIASPAMLAHNEKCDGGCGRHNRRCPQQYQGPTPARFRSDAVVSSGCPLLLLKNNGRGIGHGRQGGRNGPLLVFVWQLRWWNCGRFHFPWQRVFASALPVIGYCRIRWLRGGFAEGAHAHQRFACPDFSRIFAAREGHRTPRLRHLIVITSLCRAGAPRAEF